MTTQFPGTLGVQDPSQQGAYGTDPWTGQNNTSPGHPGQTLGQSFGTAVTDLGDSFMGHASYAPGANYGNNANADAYNNQASSLGAQNANNMATIGGNNAFALQNQGQGVNQQFQGLGNQYGATAVPQVNMANANAALGQQNNALAMYRQAAMGQGPSAAQAQLQSGLDQSIAAQQSAAASTRGGFGLANAQKQADANAGQLQGQAANNAAQLRAQEQQAGEAGYAGLGSTMQGQQAGNAQFGANLAQQQGQMNTQNQLSAYGLGANQNLAYQNAAQQAQLGWYGQGQQNQLAYNQLGQQALGQQLNADVSNQSSTNQQMAANAKNQQQGVGALMSMVGGLF